MDILICRAIVGPSGIIAMARRPVVLPFVPAPGTMLVDGKWTIIVKSVEFDVETKRVVLLDADDRTLARFDSTAPAVIADLLSSYIMDGWIVTRSGERISLD